MLVFFFYSISSTLIYFFFSPLEAGLDFKEIYEGSIEITLFLLKDAILHTGSLITNGSTIYGW